MSQESTIAFLLVSGCIVIVGLCTMVVLQLIPSGDSITPKQNNSMPQSILKQ